MENHYEILLMSDIVGSYRKGDFNLMFKLMAWHKNHSPRQVIGFPLLNVYKHKLAIFLGSYNLSSTDNGLYAPF